MTSPSPPNSWMPPAGRYNVDVGSSLGRVLKARKQEREAGTSSPAPSEGPGRAKRALPDREFYSVRYVHKPLSVDPQKQGAIRFDLTTPKIIVQQPTTKVDEPVKYSGTQKPANKYDCVLIYDEDAGTFTLEKIDDWMVLTPERGLPDIMTSETSASPTPSATATGSSSWDKPSAHPSKKPKYDEPVHEIDDIDDEIAKLMPDTKPSQSSSSSQKPRYQKEEEEEEELPLAVQQQQQRRYISTNKAQEGKRPIKGLPKKKTAPVVQAPPPSLPPAPVPTPAPKPSPPTSTTLPARPKPAPTAKAKRPPARQPEPAPEVLKDVEEFPALTRPSKPSKAKQQQPATPAPPPPRPSLALPGSSAQAALAPSPTLPSSNSIVRQTKDRAKNNPPPPAPTPAPAPPPVVHDLAADDSEEEEDDDWDEVPTNAAPAPTLAAPQTNFRPPPTSDEIAMLEEEIFGFGGADDPDPVDDELTRQLDLEMFGGMEEDEEDEEDADMEPVIGADDGPISLHALAGGGDMGVDSDDDDSSSEYDSDDD